MENVTIQKKLRVTIVKCDVVGFTEWQFMIGKRKTPSFITSGAGTYVQVKKLLKELEIVVIEKEWKE